MPLQRGPQTLYVRFLGDFLELFCELACQRCAECDGRDGSFVHFPPAEPREQHLVGGPGDVEVAWKVLQCQGFLPPYAYPQVYTVVPSIEAYPHIPMYPYVSPDILVYPYMHL